MYARHDTLSFYLYTDFPEKIVAMKITIQTLTGDKCFLKVKPYDKVRDVKVKIFEEMEVRNKVRLMWQNKQLEDGVTLRVRGVTEDATIQMLIEPENKIKVYVQTLKKGIIPVDIDDSCSLLDLVNMLSTSTLETSIQPSDFYFGRNHLSDQDLPLHFYGITNDSVITQKYEGSFELKLADARSFMFVTYFTVHGSNTIREVREQILEILNKRDDEHLTEKDIVVFHRTNCNAAKIVGSGYNELDRSGLTVNDCNIKPLDEIMFIRYHGAECFAADLSISNLSLGSTRLYGMYDQESIQSLLLKIQHQFHIPQEKQILFINGKKRTGVNADEKVSKDSHDKIVVKVID